MLKGKAISPKETKNECKTSNYRSRGLGTMTGYSVGFRYCDHFRESGIQASGFSSATMQSLLQSQEVESEGRKNGNRYELASAVTQLHNPN